MKAKLTKSLTLKTLLPQIKKEFTKHENAEKIETAIKKHINSGKSPVRGYAFKPYSKSYKKVKGKGSPVDMLVTGDMLMSLFIEKTRKGSFRIGFGDKKADYHNRLGASKKKVIRRLLPTKRGERFAYPLQKLIERIINKSISKIVKRTNKK